MSTNSGTERESDEEGRGCLTKHGIGLYFLRLLLFHRMDPPLLSGRHGMDAQVSVPRKWWQISGAVAACGYESKW